MNPEERRPHLWTAGCFRGKDLFPEHYEPMRESRCKICRTRINRVIRSLRNSKQRPINMPPRSDGFNIVCTTYRLTEHYALLDQE